MMISKLAHSDVIEQMRNDYLRALVAPMDGMWESAVISPATFREIQDQGQRIGHFCLGYDNELLRFYLVERYQVRAQDVFRWIVSTCDIQQAITSTIEPLFFSLCLDLQSSVAVHSYLFRDHQRAEPVSALSNSSFRKANKTELDDLLRFYRANTEGSGEWIEGFLQERLKHEELFVLYERQTLVATGECIPSQRQPPYADLGMVVAQAYRGRGLGSFMLIQLKQYCYETGWKPICSCTADNRASQKAIEKAGFISDHRRVTMQLSREQQ